MKDPYEVLGVSPNTDTETIKKTYRELAKKYHPDNYVDNPLADLANEKMKEINEAYDQIIKMRSENASGNSYSQSGDLMRAREFISNGNYFEADRILNSISDRTAEWYYLKGISAMQQGRYNEASEDLRIATQKDPMNSEYARAYERFRGAGRTYGPFNQRNTNECSACDICSSLMCADCCCECMGGDLISCC